MRTGKGAFNVGGPETEPRAPDPDPLLPKARVPSTFYGVGVGVGTYLPTLPT